MRSKEHRDLRLCNFRIDSKSVTYDESVSKNYHGGLKDLKYNPRVVRHVYCTRNNVNHARCIVKCYAKYMEKTKVDRETRGFLSQAKCKSRNFAVLRCGNEHEYTKSNPPELV